MTGEAWPHAKEPERYVAGCATWFGPLRFGKHGREPEKSEALSAFGRQPGARWYTQRYCLLPYRHAGAHQGPEMMFANAPALTPAEPAAGAPPEHARTVAEGEE